MRISSISSDGEEEKEQDEKEKQKTIEIEEDQLCVLCYAKKADSVIMPCGHGGICNPCSLELFAGCKDCPICRNVKKISKIFSGNNPSCFA